MVVVKDKDAICRAAVPHIDDRSPLGLGSEPASTDHTVFLETQIVHRLVDRLLNLLPVGSSLHELVYILRTSVRILDCASLEHSDTHLWPVCPTISRYVSHNLREISRILDNKHMPKHLQVRELCDYARHLRPC